MKRFLIGKRRFLLAGIAAATLSGGAYAFAASLTVTPNSLGSGSASVTNSCNVSTSYSTSYSANAYQVTTVTVTPSGVACNGLFYRVTAANAAGGSLEEWTGQFAPTAVAVPLAVTPTDTVPAATLGNITAVVESNEAP